jgi:NAD(P)-dependent dehydrogenase (short-subunit alcohol dehydrogenase family)
LLPEARAGTLAAGSGAEDDIMSGNGKLAGRIALVTGGGGEIGGAIARRFAAEGARLVIADLDEKKAEATAAAIRAAGGEAVAQATDVAKPEDAARAVATAVSSFGRLTTLVNVAAAVTPDGTCETLTLEDWNKALAVNLTGPFLMAKHAVPHLRKAGGGVIVNIASQLGQMGVAGRAPYCSSKAALIHLSKVMAMDHAKDNIRVVSLSPGAIQTARSLERYGTPEKADRARKPLYVLGRTGRVDEIAAGAVFLASDDASFMTAADLLIDGGYCGFKVNPDLIEFKA